MLIQKKKKELNIFVWLYLKLRKYCINPILFVNNSERMKAILKEMNSGETQIRSSIEHAMLNDIKNLDDHIKFGKMASRYAKLLQ
jgi:SNF2 family DNA or RNA helicase